MVAAASGSVGVEWEQVEFEDIEFNNPFTGKKGTIKRRIRKS